jgi:hypothetical protein
MSDAPDPTPVPDPDDPTPEPIIIEVPTGMISVTPPAPGDG